MSIWDKISGGDSNGRMMVDSGGNSAIKGSPSGYDQIQNSPSQSQNGSSGKISTTSGSTTAQGTTSTGSTISVSGSTGSGSASATAATSSVNNIWQTASLEGLWWAIQSSKFLADDMPFWVTIKKNPNSPSSDKYPTYIVIRLGTNTATSSSDTATSSSATTMSTDNVYDIWIGQNIKPYIIDYSLSNNAINFEASSSRIIDVIEDLEIGIMTVAGRLVVFINNNQYVYTRKAPETGLGFCKIPSGSIDIYGTNIKVSINVSPMVFARMGIMHINIPDITNVATSGSSTWGWQSVKYDGALDPAETVCVLPKPPSIATKYYGCDCEKYIDGSMTASGGSGGTRSSPVNPEGSDYHKKGIVRFKKSTSNFYYVSMLPTTTAITLPITAIQSANVCYSGCPYFFRLKGANDASITTITPDSKDISDSVISISENASSGAYSHIKKTATVTLYNSSGGVSNVATKSNSTAIATTLLKYQKGIDISWGWSTGDITKTFTGIITNVTTSDIAGKEIITLTCSDYMYILDNIPFVNSPFYDGMVSAYALKDIVKRAGIKDGSILIDWVNKDNYFLPTGLSYSQPAKRFSSEQKLLEAVIDIAQKDQSLVYFNGNGEFCITKLTGGLFSVTSTAAAVGNFVSDVTTTVPSDIVILNERSIDTNFDSTVNCISLMTLDRNTRDRILSTGSSPDDRLLFRKPALLDKPALGGLAEADSYRADLGVRIYSPILKTRFTSVGTLSAAIIPFSFITLDGQSFRVMSVKRDYSAETNDFKTSYECEWKGG